MISSKIRIFGFLIVFFFSTTVVRAQQELDSTQQAIVDMAIEFSYEFGKGTLADEPLYYKVRDDFEKPWEKEGHEATYEAALDTLAENASLKLEVGKYSGTRLVLQSYFPKNVNNSIRDVFEVAVVESELQHEGKSYSLTKSGFSSFGSKFESGYKDGESYSWNWTTLDASFNVEPKDNPSSLVGQVTFKAQIATDYEHTVITSSSKGESFMINGVTYQVIDVFKNKAVLAITSEGHDTKLDLEFVNLNNEGKKIAAIAYNELVKMHEKDSTVSLDRLGGEGQSTMYKKIYDLLAQDPMPSFEAYKNELIDDFTNATLAKDDQAAALEYLGPKYIIISTAGPIENLHLYQPVYGISKEVSLKLE